MKWREVICDRRIPKKLRWKVYKTVVRLVLDKWEERDEDAMLQCRSQQGGQDQEPEVTKYIWVADIVKKMREGSLIWMEHILTREEEKLRGMPFRFEVEGNSSRERLRV